MSILVFGVFDMLHSGHVTFLQTAAKCNDKAPLHVCVASDATARRIKGSPPMIPAKERAFTCQQVRGVVETELSPDGESVQAVFEAVLDRVKPTIVFTNEEDEHMKTACTTRNIDYKVGQRTPFPGLPTRSSASVKKMIEKTKAEEKGDDEERTAAATPVPPHLLPPRPNGSNKLVFVSGCYDLLHSGHMAFFNEASQLGDLYVSLGNDLNILQLKHHYPMFPENEREYIVGAMKNVTCAHVCSGMGMLDFESDLDLIKPDIFFVNEDGARDTKKDACAKRGIVYHVAKRVPSEGLDARSSTAIKAALKTAKV